MGENGFLRLKRIFWEIEVLKEKKRKNENKGILCKINNLYKNWALRG